MQLSCVHAMSVLQSKAFTDTRSCTLGTRVPHGKLQFAWLHSCVASAQMCSSALSQGHRQEEQEPLLSRQSCDMVAELRTARLLGQHPPSSARVRIQTRSELERQFEGTVASLYYFRKS